MYICIYKERERKRIISLRNINIYNGKYDLKLLNKIKKVYIIYMNIWRIELEREEETKKYRNTQLRDFNMIEKQNIQIKNNERIFCFTIFIIGKVTH